VEVCFILVAVDATQVSNMQNLSICHIYLSLLQIRLHPELKHECLLLRHSTRGFSVYFMDVKRAVAPENVFEQLKLHCVIFTPHLVVKRYMTNQ